MTPPDAGPQTRLEDWSDWDPRRLAREQGEVLAFAPGLQFLEPGNSSAPHAGWYGQLPLWPFERPEPEGLRILVPCPLTVLVQYSPAHPAVSPRIIPIAPKPRPMEVSVTQWHVLPDGALCLFQSEGMWVPEASTTELLLKACGWRIEYALMDASAIPAMTIHGIVDDDSLDRLITGMSTKQERQDRD